MKTFLWMVQAFGQFTGILAGYHQEQKKEKESNQTRRATVAHVGIRAPIGPLTNRLQV